MLKNMYKIHSIPKVPSFEWEFIRTLRNSTKESFVDQREIIKEEHENYLKDRHENYYIIWDSYKSLPFGFIGVVEGDIRLAVDLPFQGQGIGKQLLEFIKIKHPEAFGKVKLDNIASFNLFIKSGYSLWRSDDQFYYLLNGKLKDYSPQELLDLYNTYMLRCFYCSSIMNKRNDDLAVCLECELKYER